MNEPIASSKRDLHEKRLEKMRAEAQAEKKAPQREKPKPNVRRKKA